MAREKEIGRVSEFGEEGITEKRSQKEQEKALSEWRRAFEEQGYTPNESSELSKLADVSDAAAAQLQEAAHEMAENPEGDAYERYLELEKINTQARDRSAAKREEIDQQRREFSKKMEELVKQEGERASTALGKEAEVEVLPEINRDQFYYWQQNKLEPHYIPRGIAGEPHWVVMRVGQADTPIVSVTTGVFGGMTKEYQPEEDPALRALVKGIRGIFSKGIARAFGAKGIGETRYGFSLEQLKSNRAKQKTAEYLHVDPTQVQLLTKAEFEYLSKTGAVIDEGILEWFEDDTKGKVRPEYGDRTKEQLKGVLFRPAARI